MTVYGRCGACYNGAKKANNNENAKRGAAFFDRNGGASFGVFVCWDFVCFLGGGVKG